LLTLHPEGKIEEEFIQHLRKLLDIIIEHKRVIDCDELKYMIGIANEIETDLRHSWKIIDGKVKRKWHRKPLNALRLYFYPDFPYGISRILLRLLEEGASENRNAIQKLRKCPECKQFFIANRKDQIYCNRKCYNRWYHRDYMKKKTDPENPKFDLRYKLREFD
jgi:hypothetical protein